MAQVIRFHRTGGPDVFQVDEIDVRHPRENEVRISVEAVGLNRSDSILYHGQHPVVPSLPSLLGQEAAGTIESVGASVTGLAIGDAVSIIPRMAPEFGTMGSLILAPAAFVIKHPQNLSMIEAAALWAPFLTAHGCLFGAGNLRSDEHVVITAAASSVGLAAIQLANLAGAIPIAVTRNGSKAEQLRAAGARHVIVTQDEEVGVAIRRLTNNKGTELVIDAVAGGGIIDLAGAIAFQGRYVLYGILSGEPTPLPVAAIFASHLTIRTSVLDPTVVDLSGPIADIVQAIEAGRIRPVVDKVFELDDVVEGFRYLESNRQFGKIVLTMPEI
jgi:NADPH2:quinone reductase